MELVDFRFDETNSLTRCAAALRVHPHSTYDDEMALGYAEVSETAFNTGPSRTKRLAVPAR